MSKAFRCDRCNTCFDPYGIRGKDFFITFTEIYAQNGNDYEHGMAGNREENLNLCPKCSDIFMKFLSNETIADLYEEERREEYEQGFYAGTAFCHHLLRYCNADIVNGGRDGNAADSAGEAPERPKRAKKDGK